MKTRITFLFLAISISLAYSQSAHRQYVTANARTSDTSYVVKFSQASRWTITINWADNNQTTGSVKIQRSTNGVTYTDHLGMVATTVTGATGTVAYTDYCDANTWIAIKATIQSGKHCTFTCTWSREYKPYYNAGYVSGIDTNSAKANYLITKYRLTNSPTFSGTVTTDTLEVEYISFGGRGFYYYADGGGIATDADFYPMGVTTFADNDYGTNAERSVYTATNHITLTPGASLPAPAAEGSLFAKTDHSLYFYNGSSWKNLTPPNDTTGLGKTANVGMIVYKSGNWYGLKGTTTPPSWVKLNP